ncbi:uncharacterized protein At4g02000-like [Castanea sativa]|uniref:uncharacterized protein At4g02000-like n=1 Tax=Castanea sativa TaxID=21020 RepID=UPI003F649E2B
MADDVIHSLENMKLTTEEEEVIAISDEGRQEEIERCSQSLIGNFLTCKTFNKRAAQSTLKRAWGLENRVLLLIRWQSGMTASNVRFESASVWVQIWGAPFDMVSLKVAEEIGSRLGVVEEVEKRQKKDAPNFFMRVKVALPISKPIRRGAIRAGSSGQRTWVTFKYERLSLFCHHCGLLGHDLKHCAQYFALTKNKGEVACQYGEWMKASGIRVRSPSRRGQAREADDQRSDERNAKSQ